VVIVGYGMASSFDGAAGLEPFRADYVRLLDAIAKINPALSEKLCKRRVRSEFQSVGF